MDEDNYEDECAEHNFDANCEEDSEEQLSRAAAAMRKDRSNSISSDVVCTDMIFRFSSTEVFGLIIFDLHLLVRLLVVSLRPKMV